MKVSILSVIAYSVVVQSEGIAGDILNLDDLGFAIRGYDPVAYFIEGKAVKGDKKFVVRYQGAQYAFSSD